MPGPIGGLVFIVRPVASPADSPMDEVARVEVTYTRVEAVHRANLSGAPERKVALDSHERTIVLANGAGADDVFVAQFQVPVGFVSQLRFFPKAVTLHLKSGASVALEPESSDLPSWRNSGWKVVPADGTHFEVLHDELTGARGVMAFEERLVRLGPAKTPAKGWKMKPTLPAELFQVNPGEDEPGVFFDQLTLVFRDDTSLARIAELNARIGARVVIEPMIGTWYRVKLPATINLVDASSFYRSQPEVIGVTPGVNFGDAFLPNDDDNFAQHDLVRAPQAWDIALDGGGIGRSDIVGAVIESKGIDLADPDLRRNIWVNQGELPVALFDLNDSGTIDPEEIALRCGPSRRAGPPHHHPRPREGGCRHSAT